MHLQVSWLVEAVCVSVLRDVLWLWAAFLWQCEGAARGIHKGTVSMTVDIKSYSRSGSALAELGARCSFQECYPQIVNCDVPPLDAKTTFDASVRTRRSIARQACSDGSCIVLHAPAVLGRKPWF